MLWITRTGSPWRDLPEEFDKWNTVFKRFRDWVKADVFQRLFDAVSEQPDMEYAMVDATMVKVHRHPDLHFPAFHAAAAELRAQGHHVENPAESNPGLKAQWLDCTRMAQCDCKD